MPPIRLEFISEIRRKPNGEIFFIDQENTLVNVVCKTTQFTRNFEDGLPMYDLTFWDAQGQLYIIPVNWITLVEVSSGIFQTFTDIGDSPLPAVLHEKFDLVYRYIAEFLSACCCDSGDGPDPFPYPSNTWAVWLDTLNNDLLPKGLWIEVTEIPSQPGAIFSMFCTETNEIALGGFGQFLNADWQGVGVYTGVEPLTTVPYVNNVGQWNTGGIYGTQYVFITVTGISGGTFSPGDTVTDTTTGATGTIISCTTNTMNVEYTSSGLAFVPTNTIDNGTGVTATIDTVTDTLINGVVVIWNGLHYQVTDQTLIDGNDPVTNSTAFTLLPITDADMGYILEQDIIEFDFVPDWLQYRADKRGNTYRYSQSVDSIFSLGQTGIDFFKWGNDQWFSNAIDESLIDQINFLGIIQGNNLSGESRISGNDSNDSSCFISDNTISGGSEIINNIMFSGGSILRNTIVSESRLQSNEVSNQIRANHISCSSDVENKSFSSSTFSDNVICLSLSFSETPNDNNIVRQAGLSTQQRDVDITGLTTLDLSVAEQVGIYNLTGADATLDIVLNYPTLFPFTLRPAQGITATITITPVGTAGDGNIIGPTLSAILVGDNGDEITLSPVTLGINDVLKQLNCVQNN